MWEPEYFTLDIKNILKRLRIIMMLNVKTVRNDVSRYHSQPRTSGKWPTRSTSIRPPF